VIDRRTVELCQKAIDYQCSSLEYWVKECVERGQDIVEAQKYQEAHNVLISLRQKIDSESFLEDPNLLTYKKAERLYLEPNVVIKHGA
jgi:hypothetical protein